MATSLELAITAIRSGRKEEGRQLLNLLIQQNPNNEQAWLWMSSVVNNDEQRARCLYHVLAINPNNELARRGLQLLGIVVSDSRPVKVPRDSQPIPIHKLPALPAGEPFVPNVFEQGQNQGLPQLPASVSQPAPPPERRPFRLDPKAVTQELPFTPLREPFTEILRRSPSAFIPRVEPVEANSTVVPAAPPGPPPDAPVPSATATQPMPNDLALSLVPANSGAAPRPEVFQSDPPAIAAEAAIPLPTFPAVPQALATAMANEPVRPGTANSLAVEPNQPTKPESRPPSMEPQATPPAVTPPAQPPALGPGYTTPPAPAQLGYPTMAVQETRPSQPIWTTPVIGAANPMQPPSGQPPYPGPGINGQITMGMPTHFLQPQSPLPVVPINHGNVTMGMPLPAPNAQHPVDPMAALHASATLGVPIYAQPPYQAPFPQNQVYHSSATMAMPTMTEAEARARLMASQGMPGPMDPLAALKAAAAAMESQGQNGAKSAKKGGKAKKVVEEDDEEGEEVNLTAVIVFGSLSVTALGGLGMLILLWVTSV
jgi:hypothetical protein